VRPVARFCWQHCGWRPDASGRPTNAGNPAVRDHHVLSMARSGFLTVADMKGPPRRIGATRGNPGQFRAVDP
jgi:hypothetical protein